MYVIKNTNFGCQRSDKLIKTKHPDIRHHRHCHCHCRCC
jgi:hypothetical protein